MKDRNKFRPSPQLQNEKESENGSFYSLFLFICLNLQNGLDL